MAPLFTAPGGPAGNEPGSSKHYYDKCHQYRIIYTMKCSKCQQEKDLSCFRKDKSRKSGYMYHCKECHYEWERSRKGIKSRRDPDAPKFDREKYRKENQWRNTEWSAMRRAQKRNATPKWLTEEHREQIKALYKQGQEQGMHVDHIDPLISDKVCGLHVPWNLQLLTPHDNLSKKNKF